MSYNYTGFVNALANTLVIPVADMNFQAELPNFIDDAEQRIYRELDLLTTILRNTAGMLTPGSRNFTFPQFFVVSESLNVFTPTGTLQHRHQMIPVSREWMDAVYPDDETCCSCAGEFPHYYAMITDQTIIVGPPPDAPYNVEVIGTIRPTPLSAANPSTYLTSYLPDLFLAEACIFGYAYMKDFGAQGDDPRGSVSWNQHYQDLWQSANIEEGRKKYSSQAWTPKQPTAAATPPRQ